MARYVPLKIRQGIHVVLVLTASLFLSGCLGPIKPCFYVNSVQIKVDPDANDNSATAVDLVVAYEESILKEIQAMPAETYFAKSRQLQRDYPDQITVFHWEVVPGQYVIAQDLDYPKSCPLGGVVFARYLNPGEHRIRLSAERDIEVHLQDKKFCVRRIEGTSFLFF